MENINCIVGDNPFSLRARRQRGLAHLHCICKLCPRGGFAACHAGLWLCVPVGRVDSLGGPCPLFFPTCWQCWRQSSRMPFPATRRKRCSLHSELVETGLAVITSEASMQRAFYCVARWTITPPDNNTASCSMLRQQSLPPPTVWPLAMPPFSRGRNWNCSTTQLLID